MVLDIDDGRFAALLSLVSHHHRLGADVPVGRRADRTSEELRARANFRPDSFFRLSKHGHLVKVDPNRKMADQAQSLPGPALLHRTFPTQDTRSKQGHAFANCFSRDWSLLEKDKKRFCGQPDDQQESRRSHCEHYERPEIMIINLPAQWAFFFHGFAGNFYDYRNC
jgi:hypothetical protein